MRIIYNNLADQGTLSASPAMVATLPVTNLQTQDRELLARTTSLAAQTIDLALTSARPISSCVLYRGNFSSSSTWQVRIYDTGPSGTLLYDSGAQYLCAPKTLGDLAWGIDPLGLTMFTGWGYTFSALWFPNVYGAFVRIVINDASNPDGYMQASRLFVGQYWECPGVQRGATLTWMDTTKQMRTEGGGLHSEPGVTYRMLGINVALLPETDRIKLGEMLRSGGMRSDFYVSVFPGLGSALERDHQMQAKLSAIDPTQLVLYGYSSQAFKFEEA